MISCRLDTGRREAHLVILVTSCMVLSHSEDEIQNLHKDTDRVRVAAQRDVAESHIIIRRDMTGGNASEGILFDRRREHSTRSRYVETLCERILSLFG